MRMQVLKQFLRPVAARYWAVAPSDRLMLWWNGLFARSFQPRPIFRSVEPFTTVPTDIGERLFAIPSSQGNFERAGVAGADLDAVVAAVFANGLAISVLGRVSKDLGPWALRADDNDALSGPQVTARTGVRFNSPDFEVHTQPSIGLDSAIARSGHFYVHRPVAENRVSRAELRQADAIEIDVWRRLRSNTSLHTSRYWNTTCRDIEIEEPARVPADFARRLPYTFHEFTQSGAEFTTFPIDMVYLWVDGSDEKWARVKDGFMSSDHDSNKASKAEHRFREFDELRHSIRSVEAFAPWIRNIYIVTAGQRPKWLTEMSDKIHVVDHSEIIPAEWLPTYSSHVIAAHLHHIDGLAEHFIYFNDDVFFASQTVPERWYHPNGLAFSHIARNRIPAVTAPGSTVVKHARRSTIAALRQHGIRTSTRNLGHGPMPWRRSILIDAWNEFAEELTATGPRRFRHANDMIPDWLIAIFGESTGKLVRIHYLRGRYVAMNKRPAIAWLMVLLRQSYEYDYFCLNDGDAKNTKKLVAEWYQPHRYRAIFTKLFPFPSRFEKSADR